MMSRLWYHIVQPGGPYLACQWWSNVLKSAYNYCKLNPNGDFDMKIRPTVYNLWCWRKGHYYKIKQVVIWKMLDGLLSQ